MQPDTLSQPQPPNAQPNTPAGSTAAIVVLYVFAVLATLTGAPAAAFLFIVVAFSSAGSSEPMRLVFMAALLVVAAVGLACLIGSIVLMAIKRPGLACLVGGFPIVLLVGFFAIAGIFQR